MVRAVLFQYHTWTFKPATMLQEIAAYINVSSATLIDVTVVRSTQPRPASRRLSVTIPNGHSADHLIAVFVKPFPLK